MKKTMPLIFLMLVAMTAYCQQHIVKGQVVDSDGVGLPGVSVTVKGTAVGTQTNANGDFSITIADSASLVFSFVGYLALEQKVDPKYYDSGKKLIVRLANTQHGGLPDKGGKGQGKQGKQPKDRDKSKSTAAIPAFPWPPPASTARAVLSDNFFQTIKKLENVDTLLIKALAAAGYADKGYYFIPGGFALVTRIEQINADGGSLAVPDRWSLDISPAGKSWIDYIKSIFVARPGYFRIIVFAVTDQYFQQTNQNVPEGTASNWIKQGLDVLPSSIGKQLFTGQHRCIALIYEYKKPDSGEDPVLVTDGTLTGEDHLQKSKILEALKK